MRKSLMAAALATGTAVILAASATPALADGGFHYLALRTRADVHSVFVSGIGWTNWATQNSGGTVGSPTEPTGIDACYQYVATGLSGDWARPGQQMQVYVNQGGGRQGIGSGYQYSNPRWQDAHNLTVVTLSSSDCTAGALSKKSVSVPTDGLTYFWLSL
ncbi:hypothetical protein [Kutzneria buriramensis]|uniref:Secreted protein n=1 Tax=Kutzneria buriramensis TaxID=1045776 RepID=A0A3E0G5Z5_9PSEU|nr:hypothetical protein [Kutzneria buriramensis]REH17883.1 hypothetical protein BCF44_14225 [Kutzneria buriramensis]